MAGLGGWWDVEKRDKGKSDCLLKVDPVGFDHVEAIN